MVASRRRIAGAVLYCIPIAGWLAATMEVSSPRLACLLFFSSY